MKFILKQIANHFILSLKHVTIPARKEFETFIEVFITIVVPYVRVVEAILIICKRKLKATRTPELLLLRKAISTFLPAKPQIAFSAFSEISQQSTSPIIFTQILASTLVLMTSKKEEM